ncbi:hypothetical protein L1S34_04375 [Flavobacterium sp. K77]|uniref:hypothetical protein n=1 Tax=Flavobacterium sp. K77 TaxID=2910676 RepID=UPI001F32E0AC|nr:hypothetical protein [Flavobacterium sp. K77]MCF6140514.1 hypothetical protein [Flavobacterium sp. K77]
MKNNKQYYNPLPIDGDKNIQYDYNFDRMHKIIQWNENHCEYWNGVDYQIEVHQKSIENYDGGMGTLDWYDDLKYGTR